MTLRELLAQREDLRAKLAGILDAADAEGRDLSADEEAEYTALEDGLTSVAAGIERAEKLAERRAALASVETSETRARHAALALRTEEPNPALTGGFKSVGEFATAVRVASTGGMRDPRLAAAPTDPHRGGDSAGTGYELPAQYRDDLWQLTFERQEFLGTVDVEPTSAREVKSLADETTPWGASGVQARWRGEGDQMTPSKLETEPRSTPLHQLFAFVLATEELLEDAPRLETRLRQKSAEALAWKIDEAIVSGSGVGQPEGVLNSGALVTVAKEAAQAAATINAANVLKMRSRFLRVPGDSPYWLANSEILPALATMTIGDQPMFVQSLRESSVGDGLLLGLPIRFTEHASGLGAKGDLQLWSPRGYYAARRTVGPQMASSMHLYFDHALAAYRWTFRFGGNTHLSKPVVPPKSAGSKSHFVTLAARA